MADFSSGVSGYIETEATVKVYFPIDTRGNADVKCIHCRYLDRYKQMCNLNGEQVAYPDKYIGQRCPLKEVVKENDDICAHSEI